MPYADREKQLAYWREYSRGPKGQANKRDYYKRNRERLIAAVQERTDAAAKHEYDQQYTQRPEVKERRKHQRREWDRNNPVKRQAHTAQANFKRRQVAPDATAREYIVVLRGDPCCYCGETMEHIDHIDPISKGADSSWDNLTAACRRCNYSKRTKTLLRFLRG